MKPVFSGGCLCGAVRYQSGSEPAVAGHCQCEDCRRTSATGHASHMAIPADAFQLEGSTARYDRAADSGNIVSRHFCPTCGSAVYSTNSGVQGMVFVRASSLDDLEVFQPQMVVYASRAASWDHMAPGLPAFDTMPPPADMPAG